MLCALTLVLTAVPLAIRATSLLAAHIPLAAPNGFSWVGTGPCQSDGKTPPFYNLKPITTLEECAMACTNSSKCQAIKYFIPNWQDVCIVYGNTFVETTYTGLSASNSGLQASQNFANGADDKGIDTTVGSLDAGLVDCYVRTPTAALPRAAAAAAAQQQQQPLLPNSGPDQVSLTTASSSSSSSGWSSTDTALTVLGGALAIGIGAGVLNRKKLGALVKRIRVAQPVSQPEGALGSTADLL